MDCLTVRNLAPVSVCVCVCAQCLIKVEVCSARGLWAEAGMQNWTAFGSLAWKAEPPPPSPVKGFGPATLWTLLRVESHEVPSSIHPSWRSGWTEGPCATWIIWIADSILAVSRGSATCRKQPGWSLFAPAKLGAAEATRRVRNRANRELRGSSSMIASMMLLGKQPRQPPRSFKPRRPQLCRHVR